MASRYGRNKKRKHLAEIAALQARIEELLGPWQRAVPGDFEIDEQYVLRSNETKMDDKSRYMEYEAELEVFGYPALMDFLLNLYDRPPFVSWRGYSWKMQSAEADHDTIRDFGYSYRGDTFAKLKLVNVQRSSRVRGLPRLSF